MSLTGIKSAMCTALDTISGLRVYTQAPEAIHEPPCVYVLPKSGAFHYDAGNNMTHEIEVVLLIARGGDLASAQSNIDEYLDSTGTKSIKAVLESTELVKSTHIQDLTVTGYSEYGGLQYAETVFLGVKFSVTIIA